MEINRFKRLIETTNQVMQSNQEQLQEAGALGLAAAAAKKVPTPPSVGGPKPVLGPKPDAVVRELEAGRKANRAVRGRVTREMDTQNKRPTSGIGLAFKGNPSPSTADGSRARVPKPTLKQRLMRGARKAGETIRGIVKDPIGSLSRTAPMKAAAKVTLANDKFTRDAGDVVASGLKGAGLDSAARATRRETRKSLVGRAIDATKNIKYDSGASSQTGRPSGGRGPKASGLN